MDRLADFVVCDPMAAKGIKVKQLAKELGVTARVILDRCRLESLPIQNSASKLTPENEERVRAWFGRS